jgi:hypothetical protein
MRYKLSDYEWTAIKPMLPNKPRGVRRVNDRRVLNGIFRNTRRRERRVFEFSLLASLRDASFQQIRTRYVSGARVARS